MEGSCELCGNFSSGLKTRKVENVAMTLCPNCVKFGVRERSPAQNRAIHANISKKQLDSKVKKFKKAELKRKSNRFDLDSGETVVDNCATLIRNALNKNGFSNEVFAKKLNEKESYVSQFVSGKIRPSIKVAKKIEKLFKITLVEAFDNNAIGTSAKLNNSSVSSEGMTMADFIKPAKVRKK